MIHWHVAASFGGDDRSWMKVAAVRICCAKGDGSAIA